MDCRYFLLKRTQYLGESVSMEKVVSVKQPSRDENTTGIIIEEGPHNGVGVFVVPDNKSRIVSIPVIFEVALVDVPLCESVSAGGCTGVRDFLVVDGTWGLSVWSKENFSDRCLVIDTFERPFFEFLSS